MPAMLNEWCCRCGSRFPEGPGPVHCYSGLYGANDDQVLCEPCSEHEERMMDENGTNDVPSLLSSYAKSSFIKPERK